MLVGYCARLHPGALYNSSLQPRTTAKRHSRYRRTAFYSSLGYARISACAPWLSLPPWQALRHIFTSNAHHTFEGRASSRGCECISLGAEKSRYNLPFPTSSNRRSGIFKCETTPCRRTGTPKNSTKVCHANFDILSPLPFLSLRFHTS